MVRRYTERALGYVRVSIQRQPEGGISLDTQAGRFAAHYCQRDVKLVDIYRDGGLSGTTDNSHGLQALFEHALRPGGGITEIGVYSFSRQFRDNSRLEHYQRQLEHAGVRFVAVSDEVGTANYGSQSIRTSMRDRAVAEEGADTFGTTRLRSDEAA